MNKLSGWFLYLVRYNDSKLYTGITTSLARRLAQHRAGTGAKALRGKQNLQLVFSVCVGDRSSAQRLEYQVKRLTKSDKERLVNGSLPLYQVTGTTAASNTTQTTPDTSPARA